MIQQQVNPMELIQMIRSGQNPQQLMLNVLDKQAASNPIYANLKNLAKQNRTQEIERFARNLVESQGGDFDKEFASFKRRLGL